MILVKQRRLITGFRNVCLLVVLLGVYIFVKASEDSSVRARGMQEVSQSAWNNNNNNYNKNNNNEPVVTSTPSDDTYDFLPWVRDHYSDDQVHRVEDSAPATTSTSAADWWFNKTSISLFCVAICICTAALAAGLTLGMMSIDPLFLAIKFRSGTVDEQKQASQILPLVKQHHFLLVTLLLMNSLANEALPIFLDDLVPDYVAVILSVTLVLFFGEIIPSAIFTGPDQMSIAASLVPIVKIVMAILAPIAYPISLLLDLALKDGHEEDDGITNFNKEEIKALVRIQYEHGRRDSIQAMSESEPCKECLQSETGWCKTCTRAQLVVSTSNRELHKYESMERAPSFASSKHSSYRHERVNSDEIGIVEGALTLANRTVMDACVPLANVFVLDMDSTVLDIDTLAKIYSCGYSRIPVVTAPIHTKPIELTPVKTRIQGYTKETDSLLQTNTTTKETNTDMDKTRICGVLLTRQLIVINPNDRRPLSTIPLSRPLVVAPHVTILQLLQLFLKNSNHMALICQNPEIATLSLRLNRPIPDMTAGVLGIITMEDVLEELLKEEIYDEKDVKARNMSGQRIRGVMNKFKKGMDGKRENSFTSVPTNASVASSDDVVGLTTQRSQLHVSIGSDNDELSDEWTTPSISNRRKGAI